LKPYLISQSDTAGGAARAAFRLHQALISSGVQSRMQVAVKKSDLVTVNGSVQGLIGKVLGLMRTSLSGHLMRLQKAPNENLRSMALLPSGLVKELNQSEADVLNLHWINDEFLSIGDIAHLRKPLVWTLHDMWAFSGTEHYGPDDDSARWRVGYRADNRPAGHGGLDIDRWVWGRKRKLWQHPIHIVTPSRWLAACVKESALMREWPVSVIPNPLDTRQYQPWPKEHARALLGLPAFATVVLFGALGGAKDIRKGWDLLQSALESLAEQKFEVEGVIFGQSAPINPPCLGLPLHWMGHLNDDVTLALLYSAADVMVVPSRQENLPQSGTEAQACGCPVVAFNCTGMSEVVAHEETGYLAKPYDFENLAKGIRWVLEDTQRHSRLRSAARARALQLWSPDVVVPQYMKVYEAAIESHRK
jgi:glycosyltransferase involved in cell wall biosynthesis